MSDNEKIRSRDFCNSSQFTNWIPYVGATYHMTPQVSDFIPDSLNDTDKHIEVTDEHRITENN